MKQYNPSEIERKWQQKWEKEKIYSPDMDKAKKPFYNLMMFPYPSAEGMHVGNMYAFTGADVYGRYKRMQGNDVFEPIGLDGFGIHSENYAIKVGKHPAEQAKLSEENFYRQMHAIGNSYDWTRTVETYKPEYYKWTQWLFTQLFKAGLAYKKKAPVNFCPQDLTVLADEQVIDGACERCGAVVEKRDLEQWFFKITNYSQRLLDNIPKLDWSEKVKVAQKNWIGKSEGAEIDFLIPDSAKHVVILHGRNGSPNNYVYPWLKKELEKKGYTVELPELPNTDEPSDEEQADYVQKNCKLDKATVIVSHSFGGIVAMRLLERGVKVQRLVLACVPFSGKFNDNKIRKSVTEACRKGFDFSKIRQNADSFVVVRDEQDEIVPKEDAEMWQDKLKGALILGNGNVPHFSGEEEPDLLKAILPAIRVFTTRPDTLYGATFLVISPELAKTWLEVSWDAGDEVKKYIEEALVRRSSKADIAEKTGVFSGVYAANPVNNEEIPVWVADYVLAGYGTGAIMAVPAHDQRDFEFARKFDLPIKPVIQGKIASQGLALQEAYAGDGEIINSEDWNGWKTPESISRVIDWLEEKGIGKKETNYHLRDWLISRQRYWGPPIPMIYCEKCDWQPVTEKDLPVLLPEVEDFKPKGTGKSPLASIESFVNTKCPHCGGPAKRETDVSDTFLDSAWYFLRYPSTDIETDAFDAVRTKKWFPVTMYIGGAEHSVLHLLYSRFIAMVLAELPAGKAGLKLIDFEEPFEKFYAHGLIIKDGAKMSKSKGNVIVPDQYIAKFGADTLRMYLMFLGPFSAGGDFRNSGIEGMNRFLKRVWSLLQKSISNPQFSISNEGKRFMNKTVKRVTEDLENLRYNTAIAALMEWYNFLSKQKEASKEEAEVFLKLAAPFAPHMTEELWSQLGNNDSIHLSKWPAFDEKTLEEDEVSVPVSVNGKTRGVVKISKEKSTDQKAVERLVMESANVKKHLENKKIVKVIYVKGKIINFVVN